MRQKLLIGAVFCGTVLLSTENVGAACTPSPSCTELGYTKTQSECGNNGIKCPFGNFWSCSCDSSYIYTCTGTNENPSNAKCGNKYSMCNCATGFSWEGGECKESEGCIIGKIYYSDGTCSTNLISNKTVLGVVVYMNPDGIGGQVMTAQPIDANGNKSNSNSNSISKVGMVWSTEYVDISSLPDYVLTESVAQDFDSCSNTDKIIAYGNANTYPAAWAARSYAPTNETKGKWCLPAAGVMTSIYNNQSAVQAGIRKLGGVTYPDCCTWSSSENSSHNAWFSHFSYANGLYNYSKNSKTYYVRPVLEF